MIRTSYYQGLERSVTAGVDLAIGDFVFEFDTSDLRFEPSLIMDIYNHCLEGFDIVSASPNAKSSASSELFYSLFNRHSQTQYPLTSEDFRIISRRAINRVNQMSSFVLYRKALYVNCGLKSDNIVGTVPTTLFALFTSQNSIKFLQKSSKLKRIYV
jgi:dolichol-phosphate mannosyltransferase